MKNAQQIYEAVNEYLGQLLEKTSEILILQLCFDNGSLLFPSNERVKETVEKQMEQSDMHKYFSSKLNDFNNNTTSVSHEKLGEHQFYDVFLQNHTLPFMVELLNRAINKKKIGYFQIKKTLEKAAFGISFDVNRGDSVINYTWFSLIDIGIREFFKQLQKAVKMKQTDWRFTIDFLVPKFEAIFREIVENAGGDITKVKENGDSELKPLEDLFASSIIKEIFNDIGRSEWKTKTSPRERFLCLSHTLDNCPALVAVDNTTGDAWTEDFTSLPAALEWLNREDKK